jgi:hypothetical protein
VLPPIILATEEAEIRKIMLKIQHVQIVQETLCQKIPTKKRAGRVAQII